MQIPVALRPLIYGRSRFGCLLSTRCPAALLCGHSKSRERAICQTIYKDNEQDRFPTDFVVFFEFCLDCEDFLKLVLCVKRCPDDRRRELSGRPGLANAAGMVSPAYQGKGLGSAARAHLLLHQNHLLRAVIYD